MSPFTTRGGWSQHGFYDMFDPHYRPAPVCGHIWLWPEDDGTEHGWGGHSCGLAPGHAEITCRCECRSEIIAVGREMFHESRAYAEGDQIDALVYAMVAYQEQRFRERS